MIIFYIIFVWVLLQATPFIRDIFNLPLHLGRSMDVDMFLLFVAFVLHLLNEASKRSSISHSICLGINNYKIVTDLSREDIKHQIRQMLKFGLIYFYKSIMATVELSKRIIISRDVLIWVIPGFILYISSKANGSTSYFYLKQYLLFLILAQFIYWITLKNRVFSMVQAIHAGSFLFFIILSGFYLINIFTDNLYLDITQKNSFPILMLIMAVVCKKLNYPKLQRNFFIIGLISAIIASTKLFFVLFILLFIMSVFKIGTDNKKSSARLALALIHYFIVLTPFYITYLISAFADIGIDEMINLGESRYNINDNISSLISRLYSIPFMLQDEKFYSLLGNNESLQSSVVFWGYPVHNVYASLIYAHGLLFIFVMASYHLFIFRFFARHIDLGIILGFCIIYSNDIYAFYSLLFLPYFIWRIQARSATLNNRWLGG